MKNDEQRATIRVTGRTITFFDKNGKMLTDMVRYDHESGQRAYNVLGEAYDAGALNIGELGRFERIIQQNTLDRTKEQRKRSAELFGSVRQILDEMLDNDPTYLSTKATLQLRRKHNKLGTAIHMLDVQKANNYGNYMRCAV